MFPNLLEHTIFWLTKHDENDPFAWFSSFRRFCSNQVITQDQHRMLLHCSNTSHNAICFCPNHRHGRTKRVETNPTFRLGKSIAHFGSLLWCIRRRRRILASHCNVLSTNEYLAISYENNCHLLGIKSECWCWYCHRIISRRDSFKLPLPN